MWFTRSDSSGINDTNILFGQIIDLLICDFPQSFRLIGPGFIKDYIDREETHGTRCQRLQILDGKTSAHV